MSRYLSEALEADEPQFRTDIAELERKLGQPNHDIRLSAEVNRDLRLKLVELGLDPDDTTSEELYHTLNLKLSNIDQKLVKKLRYSAAKQVNAEANVIDGLSKLLSSLKLPRSIFALKPSSVKRQLRANPPKRVMKALGYRSIDSLLKHEPLPMMLLGINSFESASYIKNYYAQYRKLDASDFEAGYIRILKPKSPHWAKALEDIKQTSGLTLISSYELSSIIVLPIDNNPPAGYTSLLLASCLSEWSTILSTSAYLKLNLVNPDIGKKLEDITSHEPYIEANMFNRPVTWGAAQKLITRAQPDLSAPHISNEELVPDNLFNKLSGSLEEFKYWQDSELLAFINSGEVTSLNLLDVATNLRNRLPFSQRLNEHLKRSLWQELTSRYLRPKQLTNEALKPEEEQKQMAELAS